MTTHEPNFADDQPEVIQVETVATTNTAALIRITAREFTDYAGIALETKGETAENTIAVPGEHPSFFSFKTYGYARIGKDGSATLRGDWIGLQLPEVNGPVVLNGKAITVNIHGGTLELGSVPQVIVSRPVEPLPELPISINCARSH